MNMVRWPSALRILPVLTASFACTSCASSNSALRNPSNIDSPNCAYSSLWGRYGERWDKKGPLPDFSYAGYHAGESPLPKKEITKTLAVNNGSDITSDLRDALNSMKTGVLAIPTGIYLISDWFYIKKRGIVLRGAGIGKTTLFFTKSLTDLHGNKRSNRGYSQWSFGPGLLNFSGSDQVTSETLLGPVVSVAKRGDTIITANLKNIVPGQWIRVVLSDPHKNSAQTGTLIRFLLGGPTAEGLNGSTNIVGFLSRVKSTHGNQIELERPLPYDIRPEWNPEIHRFNPTVTEVGVESMTIEFPKRPYLGHFKEDGYNPNPKLRLALFTKFIFFMIFCAEFPVEILMGPRCAQNSALLT
ncbi:MAG: hypothetical protein AB7G93_13455, partial [Bdellovibrionales bacterium]